MKIKDTIHVVAGVILITIGAWISVSVGPIPFVLTNFFIILVGLILGWKKSLVAIAVYIIIGAVGLPVFNGGKGGVAHLFGLTGGFIFGFIPLAYLSGLSKDKNVFIQILLLLGGSVAVYLIGFPWAFNHWNTVMVAEQGKPVIDLATAMKYFATPYLLPDLGKLVIALILGKVLNPVLKPFFGRDSE